MAPLRILLICDDNPQQANTLLEHVRGLRDHSRHHVRTFNPRGLSGSRMLRLDEFDVVVLHWSLVIISDHYLAPSFREQIAAFDGLKVQMIQDDYRWVDEMAAMMRKLGIGLLYTLVPTREIPKIWDDSRLPNVVKVSTLPGYVPEGLVHVRAPALDGRPLEIGYRGRVLPYQIGRVGQEKVWIGKGVLERAERYGLRCDIAWSEGDRIYGEKWNEFIRTCRTMLGSESGATITDFDGSLERRVGAYLETHPGADFEEVHAAILAPYENNVRMTIVSPRVFEAIAWRTALIQFPGRYSGVIEPWRHYIPLERDFSNLDEVVARVRDTQFLQDLTARAYEDVIASGRFSMRRFVGEFDNLVERLASRRRSGYPWRYQLARAEVAVVSPLTFMAQRVGEVRAQRVAAILKGYVAFGLIVRHSALRQLFLRYLMNPGLWRLASPAAVFRDLFKLGIVWQAQTGRLTAGELFAVSPLLSADGDLILTSQRELTTTTPDAVLQRVQDSIRIGTLRAFVWDHSPVGLQVWYRLTSRHWLAVGSEGGRNDLSALLPLFRRWPDPSARALLAVLRPSPPVRRTISWPSREQLVKLWIAISLILRHSELRGLLLRYVIRPRVWRAAPAAWVLRDLFKLGIVWQAQTGRLTAGEIFFVRPVLTAEGDLVLKSQREPPPPEVDLGQRLRQRILQKELRGLLWDHSAVGPQIWYRFTSRRWLAVGTDGGHNDLAVLLPLVRLWPDAAACALVAVLHPPRSPVTPDSQLGSGLPAGSRLRAPIALTRASIAKAWVGSIVVMTTPALRRIALAYLRSSAARRAVTPAALVRDLLKLEVLSRRRRLGERSFALAARYDRAECALELTSRPQSAPEHPGITGNDLLAIGAGRLRRVFWTHAPVGTTIPLRAFGVTAWLGGTAPHDLSGLAAVAPVLPKEVVLALSRVLAPASTVASAGTASVDGPAAASDRPR
jgi:hypothetical protein